MVLNVDVVLNLVLRFQGTSALTSRSASAIIRQGYPGGLRASGPAGREVGLC
jgi:hypothetical protein